MRRAGVPKARKTRNKTPPRRRNGLTRDLVTEATSGEKEHAEVALENENKVRRAENGSGEASTEGSLGDKRVERIAHTQIVSGRDKERRPSPCAILGDFGRTGRGQQPAPARYHVLSC
jgi:hypothetical protein